MAAGPWRSRAVGRCPTSPSPTRRGGDWTKAGATPSWSCTRSTGDSHAAGPAGPGHPTRGWWDGMIGPGAPIDTDRYFVVCPNVLGGCQGTTGPASPAPDGAPYGSRFPLVTIRDQVAVEVALADASGHRALGRRGGRLHGRDAGPRVVRRLPRTGHPGRGPRRRGRRHGRPDRPVLAADPGHPLRPGVRRGRLLRHRGPPARRAGHRPWDRPGDLPDGRPNSRAGSVAGPRSRRTLSRAGATPSSPTSSTTETSWPSDSTPIPTSC